MRRLYLTGIAGLSALVVALAGLHAGSTFGLERRLASPAKPIAGGTIYLRQFGQPHNLWSVSADGEERRMLPEGIVGEPSRNLHAGQRWFLTTSEIPGETYANGGPRRELFIVREGGRPVRLTDQPDLEPLDFPARWPIHANDQEVSWIARRFDGAGEVVEGGIYSARLLPGLEGEPLGLVRQPTAPIMSLALVEATEDPEPSRRRVPDIYNHDWSPDGKEIVFESTRQELRIATVASGETRRLTTERGYDAQWSPDGSLIAFKIPRTFGAIATIAPDGVGLTHLLPGRPGEYVVCSPVFAPAKSLLAYARVHRLPEEEQRDYVAASTICVGGPDGRAYRSPVDNLFPLYMPVAWR